MPLDALRGPLAAGAVVGVDRVVGALAVLEQPEVLAVGPQARGPVVAAVELLELFQGGEAVEDVRVQSRQTVAIESEDSQGGEAVEDVRIQRRQAVVRESEVIQGGEAVEDVRMQRRLVGE